MNSTGAKRLICIFMSVVILLSLFVPAAAEGEEPSTEPVTETETASENEAVARITLFLYISNPIATGHSWVYIENLSDGDLTVGKYTVPPGEGVSLGTFFITRAEGPGLYYNVEAYCANKFGADGRFSVTEDITSAQLEKASRKVLVSNHWDLLFNCTWFALRVWNAAASRKIITIPYPWFTSPIVRLMGAQSNREMFFPEPEQVYRQRGFGDSATLEQVSSKTLSKKL